MWPEVAYRLKTLYDLTHAVGFYTLKKQEE